MRRTAQDALRRADQELADARKRQREGVVEREVVLRAEVQRAENFQQLHAATGAEFVGLAGLNLAFGLRPTSRRYVRPWPRPESIADQIAFQVNEAYRNAVTAWVGIDDARPAVDRANPKSTGSCNCGYARVRPLPPKIADAAATLTRAQQNYLNARYGYLIAMDRLAYAMGAGETPMTQSPNHH